MYSRIDTEDWVPDNLTQIGFDELISNILDGYCRFESEDKIKAAKKKLGTVSEMDVEAMRKEISNVQVATKKDRAIDRVMGILEELNLVSEFQLAKMVRQSLVNDPELAQTLK